MALLELSTQPQTNLETPVKAKWKWMALVCLLLGASGAIRTARDWQFYTRGKENEKLPFPLAEFPKHLGSWRVLEGSERKLEPEIAEIAGAVLDGHIERIYIDEKTGQSADVLILYGLALNVWPHSPAICYPVQGFRPVTPLRDQDVSISVPDSSTKARFREQHFSKAIAGQVDYRVVYHSFLNAGHWDYDVQKKWKSFRYHPGMFKVQVQRLTDSGGLADESAFHVLLASIVQEIDHRLQANP